MIRRSYEGPLSRTIKAALRDKGYGSVRGVEVDSGLPALALGKFLCARGKQSPTRRHLVMIAIEAYLGLAIAEVAALAGIAPDGTDLAPPGPLDGLTPEQIAAAETLRRVAGGKSWPGLEPEPMTLGRWPHHLHHLWRALRMADADFALRGIRAPQPSFTAWRIIVDGETAGWLSPKMGKDMAELERMAFLAGLDAIAALAIGKAA